MKIPKKVKVGPHTYEILRVDEIKEDDDSFAYGETCFEDLRIKVKNGMASTQEKETFLHEILHACAPHCPEQFIDQIGHNLLQTLVDNKLDFLS